MKLNELKTPISNLKQRKRVGRGIGSGKGKTAGRGIKGQKSRTGVSINGFEGGQMPLQRRLPKVGFSSRISRITDEVTLGEINKLDEKEITVDVLKAHNLISKNIQRVKVILSGEITKPVKLIGIKATKGAQAAIEKAKGSVSN